MHTRTHMHAHTLTHAHTHTHTHTQTLANQTLNNSQCLCLLENYCRWYEFFYSLVTYLIPIGLLYIVLNQEPSTIQVTNPEFFIKSESVEKDFS